MKERQQRDIYKLNNCCNKLEIGMLYPVFN